jgi:hypothetical protein
MDIAGIREAWKKTPFTPFRLRLADGRGLRIPHRDFLSISPGGRRVIVYGRNDSMTIIEPLLIVSIDYVDGTNGKRSRKRRD